MSRWSGRLAGNWIRFKLVVSLLVVTVPMLSLLIYLSYYSIDLVRKQVADSNANMMKLYMDQIDKGLEDVDQYLYNIAGRETDLLIMAQAESEDDYQKAKIRLMSKLSSDVAIYKAIDSFFVYTTDSHDYFEAFTSGSYAERLEIRKDVEAMLSGDTSNINGFADNSWQIRKIGEEHYLCHILRIEDAYLGAWVNMKKLVKPLALIDLGENGRSLLADHEGQALTDMEFVRTNGIELARAAESYYLSGTSGEFLVIGQPSSKGAFNLVALIPDNAILANLPLLRIVIAVFAIGAIVLFPIGLLLLRKTVLVPLGRLLTAMKKVREGIVDVRIQPFRTSEEFQLLNETFNTMIGQIHHLRIHVYEEQLNAQKAQLNYLMLQINPHFFMNSLNMMYNLAQVKKYELIQEMLLSLVGYFRYVMNSNRPYVTLSQEIQHLHNYMRIQELRYPDSLSYEIKAPDYLMNSAVPPLMIQTFIENAIKYAMTLDEPVHIAVHVDLDESDGEEPKLKIVIQDTGEGFSADMLAELQAGNRLSSGGREPVGIWNTRERLRLLYGDKARLAFSNAVPRGAVVELGIPVKSNACRERSFHHHKE
ncbi:sensor histidine kinase [Paenibacillus ginsengihumi]|uniref:sensor histidine kinase n=1 Tax=Paenibacillus ginsengihumi TaxID=431596 RepID=UPI0003710C85|nr:histidine kinase [Paenibacillus ginsengihumi]